MSHKWNVLTLSSLNNCDQGGPPFWVKGHRAENLTSIYNACKQQMHLHYLKVDSGNGGRQSKMAANPKSHAVSQTALSGLDGN